MFSLVKLLGSHLNLIRVLTMATFTGGPLSKSYTTRWDTITSREHLFGDKLAKLLKMYVNAQGVGRDSRGEPKIVNTGQPMISAVSRCLCEDCNTVKFSAMMGRVQPVLADLALGRKFVLQPPELADMLKYFERLGFLVDALSSNYGLTDEYRRSSHFMPHAHWHQYAPVYSLQQRRAWLSGEETVARPSLFIGRHLGVLGLNPITGGNAQGSVATPNSNVGRQFHMVIGELTFHLRMGEDSSPRFPSAAFIELATADSPLEWPPSRDVDYADFYALWIQDAAVIHELALTADPVSRQRHENWVRYSVAKAERDTLAARARGGKKKKA